MFGFDKPCKCCEVLKEQLFYERSQNEELIKTLTALVRPQVLVQETQASPTFKPMPLAGGVFSRRRAELEKMDRERVKLEKNSKIMAKSDDAVNKVQSPQVQTVDELEKELGIVEGGEN
jgi:hypothetical protein